MARKSRALQSVAPSGQHVALAVAAQLARTQLIPDPRMRYQGAPLNEVLNVVAQALTRTASLHVTNPLTGESQELRADELEGAVADRGASRLVLQDGRTLAGVTVRRADLRQAIAQLKAAGLSELALPHPPAAPEKPVNGSDEAVHARFAELEGLLMPPLLPEQVERAKSCAVWIARHTPQGSVANLAMQLMSALHEPRNAQDEAPGGFRMTLARLRAALEQKES